MAVESQAAALALAVAITKGTAHSRNPGLLDRRLTPIFSHIACKSRQLSLAGGTVLQIFTKLDVNWGKSDKIAECRIAVAMLFAAGTLAAAAGAEAQDAKMALCSARPDSVYYFVAEYIGQSLRGTGLDVEVIETRGSLDNLNRMARGDCDAAIAQRDALMVFYMENVSRRLKIAAPIGLYDELIHLVCRRDSGIDDVGDLLSDPERYTLLTGEPDSGSETTWRTLTRLDEDYEEVGTRALGGPEALAALAAGEAADCMMVVIGPNAPFMTGVDEKGDAFRLVPVDLFEFRDAELVDNRIYSSAVIPAGTYKKLQAGLEIPEIETIAVGATLVIAKSWAKAHSKSYESFLRTVSKVKPAIRELLQWKFAD